MTANPTPAWLEIELAGSYTFVRFTEPVAMTGDRAQAAGEVLAGLVVGPNPARLVLDFGNVTALSSLMVAHLHSLHKMARAAGAQVALCRVIPDLREILDLTWVTRLICTYDDLPEALQDLARQP